MPPLKCCEIFSWLPSNILVFSHHSHSQFLGKTKLSLFVRGCYRVIGCRAELPCQAPFQFSPLCSIYCDFKLYTASIPLDTTKLFLAYPFNSGQHLSLNQHLYLSQSQPLGCVPITPVHLSPIIICPPSSLYTVDHSLGVSSILLRTTLVQTFFLPF